MFERVASVRRWTIGSLLTPEGSEYLFGHDGQRLLWLERAGRAYGPSDAEWGEAERFLAPADGGLGPELDPIDVDEPLVGVPPVAVLAAPSGERPRTVTRSVVGTAEADVSALVAADSASFEMASGAELDYSDSDIARRAEAFLAGSQP